jgi:hypothetical protein
VSQGVRRWNFPIGPLGGGHGLRGVNHSDIICAPTTAGTMNTRHPHHLYLTEPTFDRKSVLQAGSLTMCKRSSLRGSSDSLGLRQPRPEPANGMMMPTMGNAVAFVVQCVYDAGQMWPRVNLEHNCSSSTKRAEGSAENFQLNELF